MSQQPSPANPLDPDAIARMSADPVAQDAVSTFIDKSYEYAYYRNFTWLGRPIIQFPQDVIALQELVWSYRPTLIVETGVAHGGSLILYSSLLELIGGPGEVVGIEVEFREHNRVLLDAHPLKKRITVIDGSSVAPEVVARVDAIASGHERIMVVLDSLHTHEHVLTELRAYQHLLRAGAPLVVMGTSTAYVDPKWNFNRPWTQERNPKSALDEFLQENDRFTIDRQMSDKLLITDAPGGYLRCTKDP
jgi:cephalosporin hydroxylase